MASTPSTGDRARARARARERREQEQRQALLTPGSGPGRPRRNRGEDESTTVAAATASAFDTMIPHIRVAKEKDLIELFQYKELDKIVGRPNYKKLVWLRKQLTRNATKVESPFGGGKTGHAGMVLKPIIFEKKENTEPWHVPESQGPCPIYPAGATEEQKRVIFVKFTVTEAGIIKAKKMKTLLTNQLVGSVEEDFLMELKDPLMEFDNRPITELLDHLFKNHGELGLQEQEETMEKFNSPPDWNKEIDTYYFRQQECQETMEDTDIPLSDAMMVHTLVAHVAKSAIVPKARQKWASHIKKHPEDNNWKQSKIWFRQKIKEVRQAEKDVGTEGGSAFQVMASKTRESIKEEISEELMEKISPALENMAMAATARSNNVDRNEAALNDMSSKMDALISQNQKLNSEVERLKSKEGGDKRVKYEEEEDESKAGAARDRKTASEVKTELARLGAEIARLKQKTTTKTPCTEHSSTAEGESQTEMNSLGIHCPVEHGVGRFSKYIFFVDKQYCAVCKKETFHLPRHCPEIPKERKRKAS